MLKYLVMLYTTKIVILKHSGFILKKKWHILYYYIIFYVFYYIMNIILAYIILHYYRSKVCPKFRNVTFLNFYYDKASYSQRGCIIWSKIQYK